MTPLHRPIPAACAPLLTALALAASSPMLGAQSATQPAPASQSELAAIAQARADSTRMPYTRADIDFMSGMIHHHAQAIVMARWAPTHGASESVQTLASRIINAQGDEIRLMQQWLRDRNQPAPDPAATGMTMPMNGGHEMLMPGMLTAAQMKELDAARGTDFDRKFLTFMIQHHSGALEMVKTLFDTEGAAQDAVVFKFASDVNVDQTTEIVRMKRMLVQLAFDTGTP